jgi:hypothetical protein
MVFLGLAALASISFESSIDLSCGSRWDSVGKAWRQMAGVFLAVYQPTNAGQLLALSYSTECEAPVSSADTTQLIGQAPEPSPLEETEPEGCSSGAEPLVIPDRASTAKKQVTSTRVKMTRAASSVMTSIAASVRRQQAALVERSMKRVAVGPVDVLRIDLAEVVSSALKTEEARRLIDVARAEYKINPKLEVTRLIKWPPPPARRTMLKRGPDLNCDQSDQPAPKPRGFNFKISTRVAA